MEVSKRVKIKEQVIILVIHLSNVKTLQSDQVFKRKLPPIKQGQIPKNYLQNDNLIKQKE